MRKTSLLVFGTLAATNLIAATFNLALLNFITKPLLVPALAVYYLVATSQRSYLFLTALFFCWLGDVLLMLQRDELFFIAGLVAFLTGQVLYIICYRNFRSAGTGLTGPQQIRFSLPIILAGTGLVTILFPHLGGLQIPVLVYALVITVMAMQALFRYGYTNSKKFCAGICGSTQFYDFRFVAGY
ncbi:MAG: YhhN-like protein [Bacteroidetes bacterium OLB12]|nr:MAG: YhhN-like protein [Bacteroidetes bacterium OLB12]